MKEDQTCIYYAAGETPERIAHLPQTEAVLDRGYEVLYLTDDVDEFALMVLQEYEGKSFKNVAAEDARGQTDEEKQAAEKQEPVLKEEAVPEAEVDRKEPAKKRRGRPKKKTEDVKKEIQEETKE